MQENIQPRKPKGAPGGSGGQFSRRNRAPVSVVECAPERQDPIFFVNQGEEELVWTSEDGAVEVIRVGTLRIRHGDEIIRYSDELHKIGVYTDRQFQDYCTTDDHDVDETPWFEVVSTSDPEDVPAMYDTFNDAMEAAKTFNPGN